MNYEIYCEHCQEQVKVELIDDVYFINEVTLILSVYAKCDYCGSILLNKIKEICLDDIENA